MLEGLSHKDQGKNWKREDVEFRNNVTAPMDKIGPARNFMGAKDEDLTVAGSKSVREMALGMDLADPELNQNQPEQKTSLKNRLADRIKNIFGRNEKQDNNAQELLDQEKMRRLLTHAQESINHVYYPQVFYQVLSNPLLLYTVDGNNPAVQSAKELPKRVAEINQLDPTQKELLQKNIIKMVMARLDENNQKFITGAFQEIQEVNSREDLCRIFNISPQAYEESGLSTKSIEEKIKRGSTYAQGMDISELHNVANQIEKDFASRWRQLPSAVRAF